MKRMPNMLMAGAAGRNLGKTEFLCRAIRAQSKSCPVVGIKVTTIDDALADYRNIDADYVVSLEQPMDDNKDTHRMYRSGARAVYWLRVKRPHLSDGLNQLLHRMEADGIDLLNDCLVLESGGARTYIEPGLFFIIRQQHDQLKPAVAEVADLADALNQVSGTGWDVLPESLQFDQSRWGLKEEASAFIFCGGGSRRMGEDKAALQLNGRPLLTEVHEQLIPHFEHVAVSGSKDKYRSFGYPIVEDLKPDCGPLMGLYSCLKASTNELNFITSCDVPDMHVPFVRRMLALAAAYDAVVPVMPDEKKQPLFAIYKKSTVHTVEQLLQEGKQSMHALLDILDVHYVELPGNWYYNLNTPEDLEHYKKSRP